jgi:Mg-chelatase subunit ChlD
VFSVFVIVAVVALVQQDATAGASSEPPRPTPRSQAPKPGSGPAQTPDSTGASKSAAAKKADQAASSRSAQTGAARARAAKKEAKAPSQAAGPDADSGIRVRTQAEMRKPRSPFLVAPGEEPVDRYTPDIPEWDDLPEWRRASFFGVRARGQFFVYVVDCSGSMIDDDRMPRATIELRRSVFALKEPQKFEVIFYNAESIPMPGGPVPRTADQQTKNQLLSWLRLIEPEGGTAPLLSIKQALALRPDAVFLLSDGAYPDGTADEVAKLNARKIPIHCVDLTGGLAGDHLQRIAAASGGRYTSKPGALAARP